MRIPQQRMGGRRGGLPGGRFGIIAIALVGLFLYWQMNQKSVPYSGRKQFNTMAIDQEVQLGAQSYMQILQQEQQLGNRVYCATGTCTGGEREVTERVRDIGERLEKAAIELEKDLIAAGHEFHARRRTVSVGILRRRKPAAERLLSAGRLCCRLHPDPRCHRR